MEVPYDLLKIMEEPYGVLKFEFVNPVRDAGRALPGGALRC